MLRSVVVVAGVLTSALPALALDLPARTPGLWEMQITPDLEVVYGSPSFPPPDRLLSGDQSASAVDGVLAKYIQALGGAEHLAANAILTRP